jgi:mRNA interferase MazF
VIVFPRRGELYWVHMDPAFGTEISKTRPGVIVSNDYGNQYSPRVTVAPVTTGGSDRSYPFEMRLVTTEGGLERPSKVLLNQIRTVDKRRLGERLGALSTQRMEDVNRAIRICLAV